jgi:hypothetical protein
MGFLAPTFSQPRQAKTDLLVNLMAILRNQIEHLFNVVALLKIKRMLACGGLILIRPRNECCGNQSSETGSLESSDGGGIIIVTLRWICSHLILCMREAALTA